MSSRTFDLVVGEGGWRPGALALDRDHPPLPTCIHLVPQVRLKTDAEHQFRSINRTEWQSLFDFFQVRGEDMDLMACLRGCRFPQGHSDPCWPERRESKWSVL